MSKRSWKFVKLITISSHHVKKNKNIALQVIKRVLSGIDELMVLESVLHYLVRWACNVNPLQKEFCINVLFHAFGFDKKQFNNVSIPGLPKL